MTKTNSSFEIVDGGASLDVIVEGRCYIVEVGKVKRSWHWAVLLDDPYQTQSLAASGCLRICGPEVQVHGSAKTWTDALKIGLRMCNKLAAEESKKSKKGKTRGKKR